MRFLSIEEYRQTSAFLKDKCFKLWDIENAHGIPRDHAQTGFPLVLSRVQKISNEDEIIVFENNSFRRHIDECEKAFRSDKTLFHKGNANQIMLSMYNNSIEKESDIPLERYVDNVRTETCSYIIHKKENALDELILRVDTFRMIKEKEKGADFIGGLFHALNHFTIDIIDDGQRNYVFDVLHLRYLAAKAFFLGNVIETDKPNTIIKTIPNPLHDSLIKFVFFVEPNSNIGFITTITTTR